MDNLPRWICPPVSRPSKNTQAAMASFGKKIKDSIPETRGIVDAAGIEIRCTMLSLLDEGFQELSLPDNDFWQQKCRILLLRNCVEPIEFTYWDSISSLNINHDGCLKLASALAGKELVYRKKDGVGRSVKGDVLFEPIDVMQGCFDRIKIVRNDDSISEILPAFTYASVIMAHPFSDGNGRFARAMLQAVLGSQLDWRCPMLPLAPAFYRHASRMKNALQTLNDHGDWDHVVLSLIDVLEDALLMALKIYGKK